jgi:hypothetical protein
MRVPEKSFDEKLSDLIAAHRDTPAAEIISALELQLYALREQEGDDE